MTDLVGYGMTESSPVTFIMPKLTPPSKIATIGIPYPGTQAKVISLINGEPLGSHQSGEILVRGPQVGNRCRYFEHIFIDILSRS